MFTGLLDTSVLWPSMQRDFLLSLAIEGLYRPVWSSAILAKLEEHEALKLQKRGATTAASEQRAARLVEQMRAGFTDAEITGWEPLEGTFALPDPDDEHVAAAAVIAGAGAIVTANLKDFPADKLPAALQVHPAHEFALNTVSLDPLRAARAVRAIAARSGRLGQAWSPPAVLSILAGRYGMSHAVDQVRDAIESPGR